MKSDNSNPQSNVALNIRKSVGDHPFIWGNIALMAGLPWLLTWSMSGLAVGDPVFPTWLEILLLGLPAIAFGAWLQWQQPFSPFSLWFIAKSPADLDEDERRVLTLIKQQRNGWYVTGWMAIAIAFIMSGIFCKIYIAAPLAQVIAPFPDSLRFFGIVWAEICFLLSNILLQSGVSALSIKLTADSELVNLQPFAIEKIKNSFTTIGWRSPQILKFLEDDLEFPSVVIDQQAEGNEVSQETQNEVVVSEESTDLVDQDADSLVTDNFFQGEQALEPCQEPEVEDLDLVNKPEDTLQESEVENLVSEIEDSSQEPEVENLDLVSETESNVVEESEVNLQETEVANLASETEDALPESEDILQETEVANLVSETEDALPESEGD